MSNAARHLLAILDTWTGPGNRSTTVRRFDGDPDNLEYWRRHAEAVSLIQEIEADIRAIHEAEPDAEAEAYFPALLPIYKAVFGFDPEWRKTVNSPETTAVTTEARLNLQRIAGLISISSPGKPLTERDIEKARIDVLDLIEAIRSAEHISAALKGYVIELLQRAADALERETTTSASARALLAQAEALALSTAQDQSAPEPFRRRVFERIMSLSLIIGSTLGLPVAEATFATEIEQVGQTVRELAGLPVADENADETQDAGIGRDSE